MGGKTKVRFCPATMGKSPKAYDRAGCGGWGPVGLRLAEGPGSPSAEPGPTALGIGPPEGAGGHPAWAWGQPLTPGLGGPGAWLQGFQMSVPVRPEGKSTPLHKVVKQAKPSGS